MLLLYKWVAANPKARCTAAGVSDIYVKGVLVGSEPNVIAGQYGACVDACKHYSVLSWWRFETADKRLQHEDHDHTRTVQPKRKRGGGAG